MSFAEAPTLKEQYWWTWGTELRFVLLKRGRWFLVVKPEHELTLVANNVHLKDRFVDLTRITSKQTTS